MVTSGTSILWLVKHMRRAEHVWVIQRFAGDRSELVDDTVQPDDTVASAIEAYRQTWRLVDEVVQAAPSLDVLCRDAGHGD